MTYKPTRQRSPGVLCVSSPFEMELSRVQLSDAWKAFLAHGGTHSARASTLPALIRRCERNGIPYVLTAHPGQGYHLKRGKAL